MRMFTLYLFLQKYTHVLSREEEDEETMEWEHEQLRRGGHRTPEPSSSKVKEIYRAAPSKQPLSMTSLGPHTEVLIFTVPLATPIPLLGPAISRISEQLSLLTTSHGKNMATLTSLAKERTEVDDREKEMRELVEEAESKRAWFEGFKEWTESVAGFLDEKVTISECFTYFYIYPVIFLLLVSPTREIGRGKLVLAQRTI